MKLLKCKICKYTGKQLHQHIRYSHDMTGDEYKKKYGNVKLQIVSDADREKNRQRQLNGCSIRRKEYWIKRGFNEEDAKQKVTELQSNIGKMQKGGKASTAWQYEWWIKKHGLSESEAKQRVYEIQSKNSSKSSKYKGKKSTKERNRKISMGMSSHINKVGKSKWHSHFGNFLHGGRSKVEVEMYNYIHDEIDDTAECNVYIAEKNVDVRVGNKIIELFGDYWHMNPVIYESGDLHKHSQKTAGDIWKIDGDRLESIIKWGYDVLVIWERDWHKHNDDVKDKIKRFLSD